MVNGVSGLSDSSISLQAAYAAQDPSGEALGWGLRLPGVQAPLPTTGSARPSLLNEAQPQQLPAEEFSKYLDATAQLFGVNADGSLLDDGQAQVGGTGGVMGRQLIRLVRSADERLDDAVDTYNRQHPRTPLKASKLDFAQVALLREQGLYKPDAHTAGLLDRASKLHEQAVHSLGQARHAMAIGDEAGAREAAKTFSPDFQQLRGLHDGLAERGSDDAHSAVRRWEYTQTGVGVATGVLVAGAAFTPIGQALAGGLAIGLGDAALSVGVGTMSGLILGVGRRGGEEAGHVAAGHQASADRFARAVIGDTLSAAGTSLSVALSAAGVSQLGAHAARAGFSRVGELAQWAMTTRTGEAISRGAIDAGVDVAGQLFGQATHDLRGDGTAAEGFNWRSLGISALSGAASGVGGGYIGRMSMSALKAETKELVRNGAEAAMDLGVGSASMAGMNIGTGRSLLGTFEDNFNMVASTVTTGRVSAALAGAPAPLARRAPTDAGGSGRNGPNPSSNTSGVMGRLADMVRVPSFGSVGDGLGMPVPDTPNVMKMVGRNGSDDNSRGGRGSGLASTPKTPDGGRAGAPRFWAEGELAPKDRRKREVMDTMLASVMRDLRIDETLAREVVASAARTDRTPPSEVRREARHLLGGKEDGDSENYVDFLDKGVKRLIDHRLKKGLPPPPPIYLPGRFQPLGAASLASLSPGQRLVQFFVAVRQPVALDTAMARLASHVGSDAAARTLIEQRFGLSANSTVDAKKVELAVQWMLDTGSFDYEMDKVLHAHGHALRDPAHFEGKVPYFEDFSMRPKFGPFLSPEHPANPRPGTNDPLTLLQDQLAFNFDGDADIARTLVSRLMPENPTQIELDLGRGQAHRLLKPGSTGELKAFLLDHLVVMKAPKLPVEQTPRAMKEYNGKLAKHLEETGYKTLIDHAAAEGKRLRKAREAELLDELDDDGVADHVTTFEEIAAHREWMISNGMEHLLSNKPEDQPENFPKQDELVPAARSSLPPFPNSRYTDPKRGQTTTLAERVGPAGHGAAKAILDGGLDNGISSHGAIRISRDGSVEVVTVAKGSAITKGAPGISLNGSIAVNMSGTGDQWGLDIDGTSFKMPDLQRGLIELNGGLHPDLEDLTTYLPDTRVVSEHLIRPENLRVHENNVSSNNRAGMTYNDFSAVDIGLMQGIHCTSALDARQLIAPRYLHYLDFIYEQNITLPGRQMPDPRVTLVNFDAESGRYRERTPSDSNYENNWVPAPPTPQERAASLYPRNPVSSDFVRLLGAGELPKPANK